MSEITIYHHPRCSNSRSALQLLQERGLQPRVVDYVKAPLDAPALTALAARVGLPLRELLRSKEPEYAALDLGNPARSDAELIAAVAAHPQLLNRPIVVTPKGARLCRPPELVLDLL